MSVGWSVWGARLYRDPGALTRTLSSFVDVLVCLNHDELDVPVEAAGVCHLGWSVAIESDDHVQPN